MAKGYPDFFGQSIYLRYGSINLKEVAEIVNPPSYDDNLVNIAAKGKIAGGYLLFSTADDLQEWVLKLTIDGVTVFEDSIITLFEDYVLEDPVTVINFQKYDTLNGKYVIGFNDNISFESSFLLELTVDVVANASLITGNFYYQELT